MAKWDASGRECTNRCKIPDVLGKSNYKNFGVGWPLGEVGLINLLNERLTVINCQFQPKCESQRIYLTAYKMIHISCSQRAEKSGAGPKN